MDLTEEEIEMRVTNWDKLVDEITFGGDRSKSHRAGSKHRNRRPSPF